MITMTTPTNDVWQLMTLSLEMPNDVTKVTGIDLKLSLSQKTFFT